MRLPAPRSARHAALLLLAHTSALRRPALPDTPIATLSDASNCGFEVKAMLNKSPLDLRFG